MWVFARGDGDQLGLSPWLSESARGSVYSKQIILRAYFLPGTVLNRFTPGKTEAREVVELVTESDHGHSDLVESRSLIFCAVVCAARQPFAAVPLPRWRAVNTVAVVGIFNSQADPGPTFTEFSAWGGERRRRKGKPVFFKKQQQ